MLNLDFLETSLGIVSPYFANDFSKKMFLEHVNFNHYIQSTEFHCLIAFAF